MSFTAISPSIGYDSPNDIISENFDSEKVYQDEVFYYPNITRTKNHISG
jgi:hypothetical protein